MNIKPFIKKLASGLLANAAFILTSNQPVKAQSLSPVLYLNVINRHCNDYAQQGKTELALIYCNQVIEIDSKSTDAYVIRGILYARQEKIELALADYNRAIKLNPNMGSAYANRGAIWKKKGQVKLALADYNQAILINPNSVETYNYRGNLYKEQGKGKLTIRKFKNYFCLKNMRSF